MRSPAPFQYYGSKAKLAPWIIEQMTPHRVYVEPFAGSCAVLFAKPPSQCEVINDLDRNVVTFFEVLRDKPDALIEALSMTPYARDEFDRCLEPEASDVDDLERARRFAARAAMSFSGRMRGCFSFSVPRRTGKARSFASRVDRLRAAADRIRGVEIERVDAITLMDRFNVADATIYCDPPYVASTRVVRDGYIHDNDGDMHSRMLDRAQTHRGEILISGYANPLYDDALHGPLWERLTRDVAAHSSNTRGERRTEVLWIKRRHS